MSKQLIKATSTVGSMTLISRILGFVRDMIAAQLFGASAAYDAFLVAFKIPNFMRSLFAEGSFNQAFVPLLAEQQTTQSAEETKIFIDKIAGCLIVILSIITMIGVIGAPFVVHLFAPGFSEQATRFELASQMLRITFPYLLLISLTALCSSILNTYSRFAVPAFTPVFLNLCMIGCAILLAPYFDEPVMALAYGVLLGGITQLAFQLPFLWKLRLLPFPRPDFSDPRVRRLLKAMVPALLGVSVVQINLLMGTVFASFLPSGSLSWIYYADHLMQFPLGVFGIALATVVLPHLSRGFAKKAEQEYRHMLDWACRCVLLISLPAAVGLFVLAGPLLISLFQYGAFSPEDVIKSQPVLMALAVGLLAFIWVKIFASAFYARQNLRTPVNVAIIALIANIVFSYILMGPFLHVGLAMAMTISAFINCILLGGLLIQQKLWIISRSFLLFLARVIFSCTLMAAVILYFMPPLDWWFESRWFMRAGMLSLFVVGGGIIYVTSLLVTGLRLKHIMMAAVVAAE